MASSSPPKTRKSSRDGRKKAGDRKKNSAERTRDGCLTCRIRKKKCTQEPGGCGECDRLRVECLGYSAGRFKWMRKDQAKVKSLRVTLKKWTSDRNNLRASVEPLSLEDYRDNEDDSTRRPETPRHSPTPPPVAVEENDDEVQDQAPDQELDAVGSPQKPTFTPSPSPIPQSPSPFPTSVTMSTPESPHVASSPPSTPGFSPDERRSPTIFSKSPEQYAASLQAVSVWPSDFEVMPMDRTRHGEEMDSLSPVGPAEDVKPFINSYLQYHSHEVPSPSIKIEESPDATNLAEYWPSQWSDSRRAVIPVYPQYSSYIPYPVASPVYYDPRSPYWDTRHVASRDATEYMQYSNGYSVYAEHDNHISQCHDPDQQYRRSGY